MSPNSYQLFDTWFPAIVVGFVISLLASVLWDLLRRRTWCFASRLWPGILKEVGLDTSSPSRAEVKENQQEVTKALSNISSQITNYKALLPAKSSMAESIESTSNSNSFVSSKCGGTGDFDIEAQTGINPAYTPNCSSSMTFLATAYFPDDTPTVVIRCVKKVFNRNSKAGTMKRWKSSIVLQAPLPIDPCVLAEICDLAKHCMHMEYRCTFQLDNWAIFYFNAGEVHLHLLQEGDVPVNVEARWQADRTSITMRGLYLNGAQVKAATKRTSTILRSVGPAAQGPGELDELRFPIGELDVPGEDSLIFATKIIKADGVSLTVRSEASFILPPRQEFSFIEALWGQLEWISVSARKLMKSFLTAEDRQAETATANRPEMRFDLEHSELILEHWKGVSEIELLVNRKKVLHFLHDLRQFPIVAGFSSQPPETHLHFIREVEYWQRGLQDVNEVIQQRLTGRLQSGTHISIRGGLKFLCGDFESALQDLDLIPESMRKHPSTVLVERALVKCMLARYSEALEDVGAVIAINPNENSIQELQTCIQEILDQRTPIRRIQDGPSFERPRLSDQDNRIMVTIPDLLTGDEWHSGESESPRTMSDDITDGGLKDDWSYMHAKSTDLAQPRDVVMAFEVDTWPIELQLKLRNYAEALESRYHVRRISFIANILRNDSPLFTNQSKPLSAEDQKVLNWQVGRENLQDDLEVRNDLTNLSERLCPVKDIFMTLYDTVTDHESTFHQRRPLSSYRQVSFRKTLLTNHSAPGREVELLFLYDGLPEDLSSLCWHPHDYIKLGFSEARPSYRVFWLVQWDVVDLLEPINDGLGRGIINRRSCLDHPALQRQGDSTREIHGIRRSEKMIQQPFCSCDEELKWNARESNSDGPVHGSSSIFERGMPLQTLALPQQTWSCSHRQFNAFLDKESQRRCRCKDCPWRFDSQHKQFSGTAFQPPEISSDPRSHEQGCVLAPARTGSPSSDGNGRDGHCCRRSAMKKPRTTETGSGRNPGTSQCYGVRFRPDLNKWVAEIRMAEWMAVDKKVWLGTFDTEQAAVRSVDLARKLLKCKKKYHSDFPCEKLEAYSRQIPPHLVITDLTATRLFKEATVFIKHECKEYAAGFDGTCTAQSSGLERQTISTAIQHSSCTTDSPLLCATKLQLQGIQIDELHPPCDDLAQVEDGQELKYNYDTEDEEEQKKSCSSGSLATSVDRKASSQCRLKDAQAPKPGMTSHVHSSSRASQEYQVACYPSQAEAGLHHDWRQVSTTPSSLDLTSDSRKLRRMNTERESELRWIAERKSETMYGC